MRVTIEHPKSTRFAIIFLLLVLLAIAAMLAPRDKQTGLEESAAAPPIASVNDKVSVQAPTAASSPTEIAKDGDAETPPVAQKAQHEAAQEVARGAFDTWMTAYIAAPKDKRAELEAEGVKWAVARKAEMARLIETDPEQAIKSAISVVQRRNLPPSVRKHVEEHISTEGRLSTIIATKFDPQPKATVTRQATLDDKTYEAFTYGRRNDHRFDNKTIPLNGIALDTKFAVNESPVRVVEPDEFEPAVMKAARNKSSCPVSKESTEEKEGAVAVLEGSQLIYLCQGGHIAAYGDEQLAAVMARDPDISYSAWTEGAKTLLYISIIYKDQTVSPVPTDMNAVNAFFKANSYDKTNITTTFTPTYTMSKNAMEYTSLSEIINEARALAAAGGYNYLDYTLETIRYNGGIGDFGGVAGVGGRNNMLKTEAPGVSAHEIGHNLGLWHANYWNTTDGTTIGSGNNQEYGHDFDVMGSSGSFPHGHFNAYEKNLLAWIPTTETTTVTTSGTYRLYAHDMNTLSAGNKYGINFVKDAERTYWLEYRQNSGWSPSQPWIMNGVSLLWDPWTNSNNGSQLLDTTPGSADGKNDAPIVLGRTFSDTATGVHFTLTARGGTSPNLWADVVVNVGTFPGNTAPTLSLAASSTTVQANTAVNFTATASDANGDTLAYHWDFGDNTFGTNASTANKTWAANGSKRVTCIVTDMKGGTAIQTIYVNVVSAGTYAISGNILNSGVPQAGVVVSDGTRTGTSDSLGNYAIINVPNGTYTLTPTLLGTTFAPATLSATVSSASVTGKNFAATTLSVPANGPGTGITRDWWTGISGSTVADLTGNAAYPNNPTGSETVTTLFEAPSDWGSNYGQRMHGYFIAPTTGNYRFYIASDDKSELWLSTDSTTANAVNIASVSDWTSSRQWDKFSTQKSAVKALVAGQRYYIRALHKEGGGGDNLAVGVEYPNGSIERPIPYHRLDPFPSVSWTTATQASAGESGTLTVTAQLSSTSPLNVTIPFTVTGTASGTDYTIGASPITIAAGATTGTATITITTDSIHEVNGETVILTMGTPTNAALGAVQVHTATITDDDNFVPVAYAGPDYSASTSSGTPWSPSQLSPQVWLDATTATINTGTVSIVNAGSGGGTFSGAAALTANGISTRQTVTFTGGTQKLAGTYTNTGSTLNAFFVGKSSTASQNPWTGMMSVWQTGTDWDYNNSNNAVLFGQNGSTQNSIYTQRSSALSSTTGTLTNPFLAATVFNGATNTLFLNGTAATSFASTGNFNAGNMVLCNRWDYAASSNGWKGNFGEAIICNANLSASDRQKMEGYLAHRWGMAAGLPAGHPYKTAAPVNLTVNLDGTVSDADNDPLTSTWTLVSGPDAGTITSQSSVDTTAILSAAGTYTFRLTTNDGFGPVTDDVVITVLAGSSTPVVSWTSASQTSVNESGTMTVTAQLSAASASSVTVPFTVTGTASSGDRSFTASPITIAAGATTGSTTITITADSLSEPNETVILTMGTPMNAVLGAIQVHTATITDDDTTPSVAWTVASQSSANESGTMTVTAQLSSIFTSSVTVPFTVTGTAAGADRTISASPITIAAGATTGSATITILTDTLDESNETVILTMGTPTNATLGTTQVHTATITDDDATPTVAWTAASQSSVSESGTLTVTAQLSAASGQAVSVPFTATGTATVADYSIGTSPITIAAGATTGTATITITTDLLDEPNETVILTLGTPTNATLGTTQVHTATITDDDINAPPVVNAGPNQFVTQGAPTPWIPSQLAPQLWLDADDTNTITLNGATVSQWNDKSTFGRHATATGTAEPTATSAGLNGKRVITFDGSTDVLSVNLDFLAGVSHSAFIVTKPTMFNNIYGAANGSAGTNSLHVGFASNTTYRMNYWGNDFGPAITSNFIAGSANIMNYVWTSGTSKQILANGKSEGSNASAGVIGTMSGGGRIGSTTGQGFFGGDIAEIVILTGSVTLADREKMEGYLAHKWGLAGNLAPAQPYKSTGPTVSGTIVATLDGTATDANADLLTTTWSAVSGPATVVFGNASAIDTTATFNAPGTYTLRLSASDGFGTVTSDVVVTVNPPGTYSVVYNGNGNTGGSAPAASPYASGATATVSGNTGGLAKSGFTFADWNTATNGTGTAHAAGSTFTMGAANVTLHARWITAGYDDWVIAANPGGGVDTTFNGDANKDGLANGLSWLTGGTGPMQNGQQFLPQAGQSSGNLSLSFKMLNSTKRGAAVLSLQYSRDLGVSDPWATHTIAVPDATSTVSGVNFVITPISGTDHNQVQATIPASAAGGTGKVFSRLVGTLPP